MRGALIIFLFLADGHAVMSGSLENPPLKREWRPFSGAGGCQGFRMLTEMPRLLLRWMVVSHLGLD
jgi:hypothetical protein